MTPFNLIQLWPRELIITVRKKIIFSGFVRQQIFSLPLPGRANSSDVKCRGMLFFLLGCVNIAFWSPVGRSGRTPLFWAISAHFSLIRSARFQKMNFKKKSYQCIILQLNIMIQRTSNENAACLQILRKHFLHGLGMIFLRESLCLSAVSLSRKRHDILNFSYCPLSRVLHVTLAKWQRFRFEFHLRSSPSALSGRSVDQLITS